MLCDKCHKREATVHIKQIHNGKCESRNLCAECAKELEQNGNLGMGLNFADILMSLQKFAGHPDPDAAPDPNPLPAADPEIVCPVCHWTVEKLRASGGKLGCPECYKAFAPLVEGAIQQVQRGRSHVGKRPKGGDNSLLALRRELRSCQNDIQQAIADENYEHAAVCRDRIIQLKAQLRELENSTTSTPEGEQ